MAQLGSFLDTGDKVASIVGGVAAIVGLWVAVHATSRRRRRGWPDGQVTALATAQRADAARHRYRFGEHVPALTDLYVQPRASTGRPADNRLGGRAAGEMSRTVPTTQVLATHRHSVLLGDAGAGKSTFLATVAGDLARRVLARRGSGELAIIVHASDLPGRTLPEALSLAVHRDLGVGLTAEVFERPPPGAGGWRILVDGLDEVIDAHDRSALLWRIRDLLNDGGAHRILVACRPLTERELAELRGPDVGAYDLRPFDRRELDQFARRWFTARYPDDRRRADEMAGRFLARVAGARLGPVARVPLLATIAALVYELQDDRALPSSRAALYERFVEHLLDGRRSLDRFRDAVEPELLSRGVTGKALADWLTSDLHRHVGGLLEACGAAWLADPEVRLTEVAAAWIRANGPHDLTRVTPDAHRLLRELLLASGVCTLRRDRVVFAHQSFAEYFAAAAGAATFDAATWLTRATNPVTRSLAAFAAARRPDADGLVTVLLDRGEATAAGDLLADGVPMRPATRARIVDLLLGQITEEADQAPEALRLLGELSVDADVLRRTTALAADPDVPAWTRALVADRVADVDPTVGNRLLRGVAEHADDVVRGWVADAVEEHGGRVDPLLRVPLADDAVAAGVRPLGALARHALAQRLTDIRATEWERLNAAQQLARGGDLTPLRAMAEAGDIGPLGRLEMAAALADAGDPGLLRRLATGGAGSAQAAYAAAVALFRRSDPVAAAALSEVADRFSTYPMAFGAAARSAELGDLAPLVRLARRSGQPQIRLAAARRLSALGRVEALEWLLADRLDPAVEVVVLSELLRAGHAEVLPRLAALLRRHRFRVHQDIQLRYLMAAHGDESSRRRLYRVVRRDPRSWRSIEAAIALTALADPRGPSVLRRIAGQRWRLHRTRMRAAAGLAGVDPVAGRRILGALAASGSPPGLRLRAATVAVRLWRTVGPLARIAFDPQVPPAQRGVAVQVLADVAQGRQAPDIAALWFLRGGAAPEGPPAQGDRSAFPEPLRRRLVALAEAEATPARLRIAAAPLLPEERAAAVLAAIADGAGAVPASIRMAAILRLDAIDGRAATTAFSWLLRDRGISRLRRWWYAAVSSDLLAPADATLLADRLGDADTTAAWRLVARALWLAPQAPERILGQGPDDRTG